MPVSRYLGYAAFFLASLVLGLYLTFPWDVVKDRVLAQASKATGTQITAKSLEPSWITGLEAEGVSIVIDGDTEQPLELAQLKARASILSLLTGAVGGSVWAPIGGGTVDATVKVGSDTIAIDADIQKVTLDLIPQVMSTVGLPLSGTLSLTSDLILGKKEPKLTNGTITLSASELALEKGAKIGVFPLPATIQIGTFELEIPVVEGTIRFQRSQINGTDIELRVDGTVNTQSPFSKSVLNLALGLKPTPKLLNSEPLLGPLLNNFKNAKGKDGFYQLTVVGSVKSPRVRPGKG